MEHIDTIIIGAGVIGLAIARALADVDHEVLILEAGPAIGTVTSSRNSGVIHAGVYYKPGSLKARLCIEGRDRLYAYAAERGIMNKRCGKLIVATAADQISVLKDWQMNAEQCGLTGLKMLTPVDVKKIEPEVFCTAALLVPMTGIIDVHGYLLALLGDAEARGATLALHAPVVSGACSGDGFLLDVGGTAQMQISCRRLINAAGLGAQTFSHSLQGLDPATIPPLIMAKGNYFSLSGKSPFQRLIYPLPVLGSSGLHATMDLGGQVRFGPDVEWVDHIDYHVDPARQTAFEEAVRRYWPALPKGMLQPDYAGVRPKVMRGSPHDSDFIIQDESTHQVPGLINLYGIESPGLTSSLALANEVRSRFKN